MHCRHDARRRPRRRRPAQHGAAHDIGWVMMPQVEPTQSNQEGAGHSQAGHPPASYRQCQHDYRRKGGGCVATGIRGKRRCRQQQTHISRPWAQRQIIKSKVRQRLHPAWCSVQPNRVPAPHQEPPDQG